MSWQRLKNQAGRLPKRNKKMIENINELAKFVKGGAEVLQKAMTSEEKVSLELIDGRFVTDSDLDSMKASVREEAKKEGQTIGYDFAMKDIKKDFGLEIEGKDRKAIIEAARDNILSAAKVEPNKKISELERSLENLRKEFGTEKETWETEKNQYQKKFKDISVMTELERNIPDLKGLKKNQFTTLVKSEYEFDFDDGVLIAKKNGTPVKNKMEQNIPVKDILTDYATQNGWFGSDGRGEGHKQSTISEFKTIYDVYAHMEKNNIDPMSPEGEQLITNFNKD